jgi:DNA (cytosine-5)-methyltransferase 1
MGLQKAGFHIAWSNDIEPAKREMYRSHFQDPEDTHTFALGDVTDVTGEHMPEGISLAWASSPCVDVSLAGARAGMQGKRSATFYQFTRVLEELPEDARPEVVTLENVVGLATSHSGMDLTAAIEKLNSLGYSVDVLTLDARWFVPQSRPRLFVVGARHAPVDHPDANPSLRPAWLSAPFANKRLRTHRALLPDIIEPPNNTLTSIIETMPQDDARWWDAKRTAAFEASLSEVQTKRLVDLIQETKKRNSRKVVHKTAYRRTRKGVPMWEIRTDEIAGCLRTARGGSSKQAVVKVERGNLRVRWMTDLEYARLMGADGYKLPTKLSSNQALFGFGDAVCVPAVAWLAENYLMPLANRTFGDMQQEPALVAIGA